MDNPIEFFHKKREWSKYKDLILDYYLTPYLAKVKQLRKPIAIVDCFAGPGKFDDGEIGSPLIISQQLEQIQKLGHETIGIYIEKVPELYEKLKQNTAQSPVPVKIYQGSFRDYVPVITNIAKTHTTFVYVDPIKPSDLLFDDLSSVYSQLKSGQSIETLINFMSTNFLRGIWGSKEHVRDDGTFPPEYPPLTGWNQIAGGDYWQPIAFNENLLEKERIDRVAQGYADKLHQWFKYVLTYPIREAYEHKFPKYHLAFGSRRPDAVDLMNDAMVKARREFVGAQYVKGMLFDNQPKDEVVDIAEINKKILNTIKNDTPLTWKMLRIATILKYPCMYTVSEFNKAIKNAIKNGQILSTCSGSKIENDAQIWLP